jgi:uncharacterized protein YlaI
MSGLGSTNSQQARLTLLAGPKCQRCHALPATGKESVKSRGKIVRRWICDSCRVRLRMRTGKMASAHKEGG